MSVLTAGLLDTAQRHIGIINKVIDQLTLLGAEAELRVVAIKLSEASFRAAPTSSDK